MLHHNHDNTSSISYQEWIKLDVKALGVIIDFFIYPLEILSRYRDPRLQVGKEISKIMYTMHVYTIYLS